MTDKGFTLFEGCRWLASQGVAFVGMYKTHGRPKQMPKGPLGHWPIRGVDEKNDAEVLPRGVRRESRQHDARRRRETVARRRGSSGERSDER